MNLSDFQGLIRRIYFDRDSERGIEGTFMWLTEEVGELSRALLLNDASRIKEELADVAAWLVSVASIAGVDMEEAIGKYRNGCPKCSSIPCQCKGR
jgi:NTP pyrophosphatase (non-canonical NTP hydrolase)